MHHSRFYHEHVWDYALHLFRKTGEKKVALEFGLGGNGLKMRAERAGLVWKIDASTKTRHEEHVFEWAIDCYRKGEDGFKAVAKRLGVAQGSLRSRIKASGLEKKVHASTRKRLSGCRVINEVAASLRSKWESLLRRVRKPYVRTKTQMERYYADHEASKERLRISAAKRHERIKHTGAYKMKSTTRNTVARIARMVGSRRKPKTRTHEFLGCDYPTARSHIESQFKPGMAWNNHGTAWEIDHIKPLASFNLLDEAERMQAMHYTNLQPLWKADNRAKSDKYCATA